MLWGSPLYRTSLKGDYSKYTEQPPFWGTSWPPRGLEIDSLKSQYNFAYSWKIWPGLRLTQEYCLVQSGQQNYISNYLVSCLYMSKLSKLIVSYYVLIKKKDV